MALSLAAIPLGAPHKVVWRLNPKLLKMVHAEKSARPDARLEACIRDVMVTTDKVLVAQSHEFKNISPYGESLFAMAENP